MTFRAVLTILLFIFLAPVSVKAQTLVGPGGLTQSVIDAAAAGGILELTGDQTLTTTLTISKSLTIRGQGTNPDGTPAIVIKQTGTDRHFISSSENITLTFQNLAIIGPNAAYNNGVVTGNGGSDIGGGIAASVATITLNIESCVVAGCNARNQTGSLQYTSYGGGIYAAGPLTLSGNNTVSYNKAGWTGTGYAATGTYHGGGIYAGNTLVLKGALVCAENGATGDGGGIYKSATGAFTATELASLELTGNGAGLGGATIPGNGGGMYTAVDLKLENLTTCSISNNTAKPYSVNKLDSRGGGGGIYTVKTLVLKNAVIDNNSVAGTVTGQGALAHFSNRGVGGGGGIFTAGDATLENVTLINNTSTTTQNTNNSTCGGGGICVAAKLTLNDATVRNNTSSTVGGGIFAVFQSTLNNVVVNDNQADTEGGGIYAASTLNLNNSTVDGNRAEREGGGVYTALTQTMASMAPTLNSSTITNNSAGYSGGGVYAIAHLALKGTNTISNNQAGWSGTTYRSSGHGGGIYVNDLTLNIADTLICKENIAGGNGGGIYKTSISNSSNPITVTNLKLLQLEENESKYAGGGIYSTVHIDFSKLPKGSSISGNRAGSYGGGVCAASSYGTGDHLQVIKLRNLTINNNTAAQYGGGIYAPGPLTISGNTTVSGNKAGYNTTTQTFSGNYHGGGIYAKAGLTLIDTLTCERNGASGYGGGIYKVLTIDTTNPFYSTLFNVKDLKLLQVNENTAKAGGGIYTANSLKLGNLQKGSSISRNTASDSGGGIYMSADTASLRLNNTVVNDNRATNYGGGIHAGSEVTLAGVTVNNNTAGSNGGGVYAISVLSLSGNDTISYNKAGYNAITGIWKTTSTPGGGIYAANNLILKDTLVCNGNTATGAGGGIWKSTTGTTTFEADELVLLEVNGNTAGYNAASNQLGGGIYAGVALDLSKLKQGFVSNNKASSYGGGIYALNKLSLSNTVLSNNTTGSNGGAIYASAGLQLDSLHISNNTATNYGGGIYAAGDFKSNANTFAGNKAVNGGGVYLANTATVINSTFSANTATTNGGAVYANASAHNISLSTFNGNTPAAVYFAGSANQTLRGNILYGNGTQEANIKPAIADYNIIRGLNWGGTNKNVAAGKADSIFAVVSSGDLATLADNGGPTQTLDIKQNGLAHDFIPNSVFYPWNGNVSGTDQRGLLRPFGCKADAGAVELQVEKLLLITVGITGVDEACTGDELLFTGERGYATYNWSGDGGIAKGNGDTYQEYFKWTTEGTKTVTFTVDDGYGCTSSGTKTILIHLRPETGPMYRVPNLQ